MGARAMMMTGAMGLLLSGAAAAGVGAQHHGVRMPAEEVRYRSGELELAALLYRPEDRPGPHPAAVLVRGSGETPRNNPWTLMIAGRLLDAGVAVLVPDKRGQGASEGDWRTASMEDRAGDALAGVRYLRGRPELDRGRIGLVGLSQGGRVVPLAASMAPTVAFVLDISGSAVPFEEQSNHEMANMTRQAGHGEEAVAAVLRLNGLAAAFLRTGSWEPYRRDRAAQLHEPWGGIVAGFPAERDAAVWSFYRKVIDYDPIPYWNQVEAPALIVYGAEDEGDNVPVRRSVERLERAFAETGKENHLIQVFPGVGHGLLVHDGAMQQRLHPDFVALLDRWLEEATAADLAPTPTPSPNPNPN